MPPPRHPFERHASSSQSTNWAHSSGESSLRNASLRTERKLEAEASITWH